jgi:hypothetical protein
MRPSASARRLQPANSDDLGPQSGPALVPARPRSQGRHSPLAHWHLLSLDAPSIASLWTIFIARCAGLTLHWSQPAAMFIAVWMIYAADRLLDARLLDAGLLDADLRDGLPQARRSPPPELEARHRFHHHHRGGFLAFIVLAALALVMLLESVPTAALHLYALLATLVAAWLLLIHARPLPTAASHRLPKELAVGVFFSAAVFIPTVAREPTLRSALLPAAALFATVCTLNCLFLYAWEHPTPRLQAHWTTRWATAHLIDLATLVVAVAALAMLSGTLQPLAPPLSARLSLSRWPALACALSTALLLLLHLFRRRLSTIHLRASADLVLLTPLLLMAWGR